MIECCPLIKQMRYRVSGTRQLFVLVWIALLTVSVRADDAGKDKGRWLKPPALRPGDTIMFVSPAGPADPRRVDKAARRFRDLGFQVVLPKTLYRATGYLAGSDDQRADELNRAIRDPHVTAVFPCRGGYGMTRILDRIDYRALRQHPKVIIGYSDITALHLAIARKSKVITFHSPMPQSSLWRDDGVFQFAASAFWRMVAAKSYAHRPPASMDVPWPTDQPKPKRLVGGQATGRLIGGNLSLICAALGTPFAIETKGRILFLEDTDEAPYRVDRMFSQLRLAGLLDAAAGVIVGTFDKTDTKEVDRIVREYCATLKGPVITGFPVGHSPWNATLPIGCPVELDADRPRLRLLEAPVSLN